MVEIHQKGGNIMNNFRKKRIESGLTQKELAEALGISLRSVIGYEHGTIPKSYTTRQKIGEFFKSDGYELFFSKEDVADHNDGCDCVYCKELFTGDSNESISVIDLNISNINVIGVQVFINNKDLEVLIDTPNGETVQKDIVRIKYCPFCGRKL